MKANFSTPKISRIKVNNDFTISLKYGKEKRIFDMKPYLNIGMYKDLQNIELFKTARISFDSLEWANGIDIDPEFLYSKSRQ